MNHTTNMDLFKISAHFEKKRCCSFNCGWSTEAAENSNHGVSGCEIRNLWWARFFAQNMQCIYYPLARWPWKIQDWYRIDSRCLGDVFHIEERRTSIAVTKHILDVYHFCFIPRAPRNRPKLDRFAMAHVSFTINPEPTGLFFWITDARQILTIAKGNWWKKPCLNLW